MKIFYLHLTFMLSANCSDALESLPNPYSRGALGEAISKDFITAIEKGDKPWAESLLKMGFDINFVDEEEKIPLMHAAAAGSVVMFGWLLYKDATEDVDTLGKSLVSAASRCRTEVIDFIFRRTYGLASVVKTRDLISKYGVEALHAAIERGCHVSHNDVGPTETIKELVDKGIDVKGSPETLHWVVDADNIKTAECLLALGIRLDGRLQYTRGRSSFARPGQTVVLTAISRALDKYKPRSWNSRTIARSIVNAIPKEEFFTDKWNEDFLRAVERGWDDVVEAFVNGGIDVNAVDENGRSAVAIAHARSHVDIEALLVRKGARLSYCTCSIQ